MTKKTFCDYIYIYKKDFYIIAYAILKDSPDAEDAVSNAILKGYENLGQLRDPRKFRQWMLMITKNEALKLKKKRFDRDIKKAVKNFQVPESYDKRVEETIQSLSEEDVVFPWESPKRRYKGVLVFVCACIICTVLFFLLELDVLCWFLYKRKAKK